MVTVPPALGCSLVPMLKNSAFTSYLHVDSEKPTSHTDSGFSL